MPERLPLEKFKQLLGEDNGTTDWILIDQERINHFAEVTGDHQWIHVDTERAGQGPFGTTIAHGFLTLSFLSMFGYSSKYSIEGAKMTVNYGLNKVRFINPVPVGSRIRSKMVITSIVEKGPEKILVTNTHTVEIEGQEKPACIAEALSMYFL